ncbi:hypothetical protein CO101_01530 [Candidatus Berkelbacteria bacterium CG_4_9_14_3_um_filter_39_23]|uniref:Uncharacterized protein n=2 Tax=Candidatus Berkelbacteria TaxID=1618330 RepID=A0A2M7CHW0_9BACT|nr:hypothetical protein [Candidatus Berkelbacteria bacterium]OIP06021.1 MAG: hypothetical protein AUK14_00555 [Candidatus Berkelbacteria bacterium CG2_30_39_44]PIR27945.1 MAG: hypothetical protein COV39_01785 [Candidatus Berkelbacteria bacterium CG11_big_fil_rev_8_21_14_0_20_40_23]PIV25211.1 MAG: hypothetical protein COS38_02815 [Candidatus Berkelbacteria bacterium CG03_land_8_20_14_0_80_40_36]PIX30567.1 MAG: hypothetical protein COZ62_02020 [Candidatus Berkelbacteria bacterium CG_4_8_14_3_um_f
MKTILTSIIASFVLLPFVRYYYYINQFDELVKGEKQFLYSTAWGSVVLYLIIFLVVLLTLTIVNWAKQRS